MIICSLIIIWIITVCAMSFIRSSQITELQQKIIDAEQGIFYACNQS